MSEPFIAELRLMSFGFAPKGWAQCNGQLMPINQNQPLFSLLGTAFGGDGRVNFALPDLRGRVPVHFHGSYIIGQQGGEERHTLTQAEMPAHIHALNATTVAANNIVPVGNMVATAAATDPLYSTFTNTTPAGPSSISPTGQSQSHENRQPYLVLNYCIALQGIFPSQN
jgi:microcystin-dependent protein